MLVPLFPGDRRFELLPVLAVPRVPDIAPVFRWIVRPAAQDPHAIAIDDGGEPDARRPGGFFNYLRPVHAVVGTPHVVERLILRHVIAAAENPDLAGVDHRLMIGARRPTGIGRRELPLLTVGGMPHVVLEALVVAEVVILGAAQDPHLVLRHDRAGGETRRPSGALRR